MTHKGRWAKRGAPIKDRLRLHSIVAPSGCWIWIGCRGANGYGQITVAGKSRHAHRISYELYVGPIPEGYHVDHLCRRPACIRPQHLQAVTPQINMLRGTSPPARAQRRDNCLHGHPYATHGYQHGDHRGCRRCDVIGAGEARIRRVARAERDPDSVPHGTTSGYGNWGCRCDPCREANSAYFRARRIRLASAS